MIFQLYNPCILRKQNMIITEFVEHKIMVLFVVQNLFFYTHPLFVKLAPFPQFQETLSIYDFTFFIKQNNI